MTGSSVARRRGECGHYREEVPLRLRLLVLFAVLASIVVGAAIVVSSALGRLEQTRGLITEVLQPASVESRSLLVSLVDQETGARGYVLTGDETFLVPYTQGRRTFEDRLRGLRDGFADDAELQSSLNRVEEAAATWVRVGAEPEIEARRTGGRAAADRLVDARQGKTAFDDVRRRVADLQRLIDERSVAAQARASADLAELRVTVLGSRALLLAVLVLSALLLRSWVLAPVQRLRASMRRVSGGDLGSEVVVDGPPEVAAIGADAESMRRRILSELEVARSATEALSQHSPVVVGLRRELASRGTPAATGLDIAGVMLAAEGVLAGDWWEALLRPDGSTALVVADVSGHGAEAGLVALRFKQRITALLDSDLDLGTAFGIAAQRPDDDVERFLSCLLVVVDPQARQVSWINAGHPPALLVSRDGDVIVELHPTGPLISSVTSGWEVDTAPITRRDMLLVCTDGVLEARNRDGEEFGAEGVLGVLRRLRRWSPQEAVAECSEAVRQFAVDVRRDDVTFVAVALADA